MMSIEYQQPTLYQNQYKPLVVILGPTAVGKTQFALQIASCLSAEIISADSRLLYIGMDIGTAKPSQTELAQVPHHLIDVTTPDQIWSLAQYQAAADEAINSIHQRGKLPILVGGTGQYIHAITQGWQIPAAPPNPTLRQVLEKWAAQIGGQALHDRLTHLDPTAAAAIDPSNLRRTIRALEVILSTGRRFSEQKSQLAPPFTILRLGINRPRPELYQRVDERIAVMIKTGFIEEVQRLLSLGYAPELPTMSAIGYGEISVFLRGACTLEEAVLSMKRRTRIFIRRQANWFKLNDPSINWFTANHDTADLMEHTIYQWLSNLPHSLGVNP